MQDKTIARSSKTLFFSVLFLFPSLSYGTFAYIPSALRECVTAICEGAQDTEKIYYLEDLYSVIRENRILTSDKMVRKAVEEAMAVVQKDGNIFRHSAQKDAVTCYLHQYVASLENESMLLATESNARFASWPVSLVTRCLSDDSIAADMLYLSSELTYNQNVVLCGNGKIDFASEYLPSKFAARDAQSTRVSPANIVFNANMMTNSLLSSPSMIFGTGVSSPSINAWIMSQSSLVQSPINVQFAVPTNYKRNKPVSLELHFLVKQQSVPNGNARIRVNAEYIKAGDDFNISDPVPTFTQTIDSDNFTVTQPSGLNDVRYLMVKIPLDKSVIAKHKFALYSLTRIAPTVGLEYTGDIYLAAATFRYYSKH
ncbi:MAG TPA: hypothetical protein VJJ26_04950 [Candidatus Babeliales bacterium]|nr:hypothetical protein [Candidatus Babeliales bacterium]